MPPGASLWAAVDETRHSTSFAREAMWFHVAAAATGFAILSKGAPGAFVGLFLVGLILIERRWSLAWNFLRSGALVTLVVIALPWFVYVGMHAGWGTFTAELNNNIEGGDHAGSMFQYVPELFVATAPWCGLMPIAIFAAIQQRRDVRMRRLLIWILAIAIPLCIEGNKQKHYLLPLMPPLMLLVGWLIDRSIARRDGVFGLARVIMWIMGGLTALAAIGVLIAGYMVHKRVTGIDVVMVVALFSFAALLGALWRQGAAVGIAGTVAVSTILMPLVSGLWAPTLATNTAREVASQVTQSFGNGPYGFVSGDISLPLCWEMRTAIPRYETPADALAAAQRESNLAVISLAKDKRAPAQLPPPWVKKLSLRSEERILEVYQLAR
jgi:4-amino-4-deoxy-L-arabinose transferase-like glycosyltransferase